MHQDQVEFRPTDVQSLEPATRLSLSRVGVTGVEKVIRMLDGRKEQLFYAELDCFVDLSPHQAGVHMSRFEEIINEAIDEVVIGEAFKVETLATHISEKVRERHKGARAEVTIRARYPEHKITPSSKRQTQELYWINGRAVTGPNGTRKLVGVTAQGMTACPCAQAMVIDRSSLRLKEQGFTDDEIERVFQSVPAATHNQRGVGTLYIGTTEDCGAEIDAQALLGIVESSMSSEIYELMKRPDEVDVVERAHFNPRFVEDCAREMIRQTLGSFECLGRDSFLMARQENMETIHQHNVIAERYGTVGELRTDLETGTHPSRHTTMREWLDQLSNV